MSDVQYRRNPTRRLRYQIILRDFKTCRYCEKFIANDKDITLDHVIPWSEGGRTVPSNLVVACKTCNARKANKTLEQANMKLISTRYLKKKYKRRYYPASHWIAWEYACGDEWSILYIHVRSGPENAIDKTVEFEKDLTLVDECARVEHHIVGIEVLNPERKWGLEKILQNSRYEFSEEEKDYLRWIRDAKPWHGEPTT